MKKLFKYISKICEFLIPSSCILLIIIFILTDSNVECDTDKSFVDIRNYTNFENQCINNNNNSLCSPNVVFYMEQNLISMKNQMKILVTQNQQNIYTGTFVEKVTAGSSNYRYRYRDKNKDREFVVADINKKRFLSQFMYLLSRCDNSGYIFKFVEKSISIDNIEYQLFKNDILIAESSEDILTLCKSAIQINDNNSKIIALLERGCAESFLRDKWKITNFRPDLVDDYVLGFLAYLTTLKETVAKK